MPVLLLNFDYINSSNVTPGTMQCLQDATAPHAEVDVVRDPFPELRLTLRARARVIVRAPGSHDLVVDGPHPHAASGDLLLPVHRNRGTRIQDANRGVLREVLETAHVDVPVLAQTVVLF